ncbi:MAG: uridine kinase [Cyanobacteria bacterium P01_H01_bin.15]
MEKENLIIAICGGSASGKTTLANDFAKSTERAVTIIREDDYNLDHASNPEFDSSEHNFDHIDSRDSVLLAKHMSLLKRGKTIDYPEYCFKTHSRLGARKVSATDVIIVEGMHILFHENIRVSVDFSVFIDVPDDIRLSRRIIRDRSERNRSCEVLIRQYLRNIRPMHHKFVQPSKRFADLSIDYSFEHEQADANDRAGRPSHELIKALEERGLW